MSTEIAVNIGCYGMRGRFDLPVGEIATLLPSLLTFRPTMVVCVNVWVPER